MKRLIRFTLNVLLYLGIVAIIVWGLPTFLSWKLGTPYPIAAITSGSMWPVLKVGDMVLIEGIKKEDLKVGDIIVWSNEEGGFTIHRVVKLESDKLTTKGDANFDADHPVPYSDLIGRMVRLGRKELRIPYLGYISIYIAKYQK